ncbi:MAG: preprotein translocase subunit SecG [Flavobacteriales bacterium]|nr:preprotein translocase subunit SecG [Flavobacteriales bacterium]
MTAFLTVLIILVCLVLAGVILIQNSKGGGLSASFSSSNQIMGARRTTDFLEKATWILAISLLALSLVSSAVRNDPNSPDDQTSTVEDIIYEQPESPANLGPAPSPAPAPGNGPQ